MPLYTVYGYVEIRQGWEVDVHAPNQDKARERALIRVRADGDEVCWQSTSDAELISGSEEVTDIEDISERLPPSPPKSLEIHPEVFL
jgi:hypothetical protein